jgi:hypothetical protein
MDIPKLVQEILVEKESATNKDKMGLLLDKAIDALNAVNEMTPDEKTASLISIHNDQLKSKDVEIDGLKLELTQAQEIATEAIDKLNVADSTTVKAIETKVSGKSYVINYGVNFGGKDYTAKDLSEDSDLSEKLVEMGSGALTLKEGK